jgi:CDP-4-dehydro-6-deoxyglucose reductase, E1
MDILKKFHWPLASETVTSADRQMLSDWILDSDWLAQGQVVRRLEDRWSEWVGAAGSVMVSSGTAANLALAIALSLRAGRKLRVGAPAVTWPTTITPFILLGHEVVLFDIDPKTLGVSSSQVCVAMREGEIDVLFVVHLLGFNALTSEMISTAEECGVLIIEDCCEATGTCHDGQRAGTLGLAGTYSYYFGHHMSSIEGGMISSNDLELLDRLRMIRSHGMARESSRFREFERMYPSIDGRFLFPEIGLNLRSTDLNATLALEQLGRIDPMIAKRNENALRFFENMPEWIYSDFQTEGMSSFALPVLPKCQCGLTVAKRIAESLGIETRPIVAGNLLRQPFARESRSLRPFAETFWADIVHERGFYLGNGAHVSEEMIRELSTQLNDSWQGHAQNCHLPRLIGEYFGIV